MVLLPDKPYFGLIERRIPSPGETVSKIAASIEKSEQEAIGKEIAKRRMRLGANLEQVTKDVKREVLSKSDVHSSCVVTYFQLEGFYQKVIDWSEDVETRRKYESKLLRHARDTLLVCFPEEREMRRDKVWQIAHGMVVLNIPDELAWTISVDWKDFEFIGTRIPTYECPDHSRDVWQNICSRSHTFHSPEWNCKSSLSMSQLRVIKISTRHPYRQ